MMILAASTSEALTEGGLARAAAVFIPVLSVFLGMLFAMRYHNFYERFDELLQEAGVEGFTESQKQHLNRVRLAIFFALGFFIATLVLYIGFGIPPSEERRWALLLVCAGLFVLDGVLLAAAISDMRNGITRPWLRFIVMTLGAMGVVAALVAGFALETDFLF